MVTRIKATDLDTSAELRFKLSRSVCDAKSERGTLVKQSDFDCYNAFEIANGGILKVAQTIDRETVELFNIGVIVEDVASNTGLQVAEGLDFQLLFETYLV